jgi:hypothetical protein
MEEWQDRTVLLFTLPQSPKGKSGKSPIGHRFQIPNLFSPLLLLPSGSGSPSLAISPPPHPDSEAGGRLLLPVAAGILAGQLVCSSGSRAPPPPEFDVRLYPMDPHRLNCPAAAAADADTADTEDWGNHRALFPRSFDFFTSMLVFRRIVACGL